MDKSDKNGHPRSFSIFMFKDVYKCTGGFCDDVFLGRWNLGTMYKAVLKDGTPLVIKRGFGGPRRYAGQIALTNELRYLTKLPCDRYFTRLYGLSDDKQEKLLMLEMPRRGTLFDVLHCARSPPLPLGLRIHLAVGVARALKFLHYKSKVVHRDLRSCNVWVDGNWNPRIANFALAMDISLEKSMLDCPIGTICSILDTDYPKVGYLAPKVDVFCFGVLLLEIISNRRVFTGSANPCDILAWGLPHIRKNHMLQICDPRLRLLPQQVKVPRELACIAAACVGPVACARPTMSDVLESLRHLGSEFPFKK